MVQLSDQLLTWNFMAWWWLVKRTVSSFTPAALGRAQATKLANLGPSWSLQWVPTQELHEQ